jgi:hypothetical protein
MLRSFATSERSTCLRWPAVLLGCVLSVLAPFGESTIVQLIEGGLAHSQSVRTLSEGDSIEDEEDLYRPRLEDDSWRIERKHAASLLCCFCVDQPDSFLTHLQARRAAPHHHGPGCEHAYRNGSGGPLLC